MASPPLHFASKRKVEKREEMKTLEESFFLSHPRCISNGGLSLIVRIWGRKGIKLPGVRKVMEGWDTKKRRGRWHREWEKREHIKRGNSNPVIATAGSWKARRATQLCLIFRLRRGLWGMKWMFWSWRKQGLFELSIGGSWWEILPKGVEKAKRGWNQTN